MRLFFIIFRCNRYDVVNVVEDSREQEFKKVSCAKFCYFNLPNLTLSWLSKRHSSMERCAEIH